MKIYTYQSARNKRLTVQVREDEEMRIRLLERGGWRVIADAGGEAEDEAIAAVPPAEDDNPPDKPEKKAARKKEQEPTDEADED